MPCSNQTKQGLEVRSIRGKTATRILAGVLGIWILQYPFPLPFEGTDMLTNAGRYFGQYFPLVGGIGLLYIAFIGRVPCIARKAERL